MNDFEKDKYETEIAELTKRIHELAGESAKRAKQAVMTGVELEETKEALEKTKVELADTKAELERNKDAAMYWMNRKFDIVVKTGDKKTARYVDVAYFEFISGEGYQFFRIEEKDGWTTCYKAEDIEKLEVRK